MKTRKHVLLGLALATMFVAGCAINTAFVHTMKFSADLILPEYKAYVEQDPNLDEASKKARIAAADEWQKTIDEAGR